MASPRSSRARGMQGIAFGGVADGFGNVARDVHAAHDPDFLDLGDEDVRVVRAGHARSRILLLRRHSQDMASLYLVM